MFPYAPSLRPHSDILLLFDKMNGPKIDGFIWSSMIGSSLFFCIIVMMLFDFHCSSGSEWTEEQISSVKTIFEDYYYINGQIYYFFFSDGPEN